VTIAKKSIRTLRFRQRNQLSFSEQESTLRDETASPLRQSDILWKIRPFEDTPKIEKLKWKASAELLRLDYRRENMEPPLILCPPGGKLLLEAWHDGTKIGRFGITSQRGPSFPPLEETIEELYGIKATAGIGIGAIIFMFVEPEYRGRSVGKLALDIVGLIHATVGADFTILVADDKSEANTLIQCYERLGFKRAPKLQDFMGSPNGQFGLSMIAPVQANIPEGCRIEWW
jgi:GNAT superfamily N-acetyltransferase